MVPWAREPTGQVIADCLKLTVSLTPVHPQRARYVLGLYEQAGLKPVIAPRLSSTS